MSFILFTAAFAGLSFLLTKVLTRFSHRMDSLNKNEVSQVRWASHSKPLVGGISFFLVFLLSLLSYFMLDMFAGAQEASDAIIPLVLAGILGFLIGLADDAYTTNPMLKFIGQFACGILFIVFGAEIQLFDNNIMNYILTVFWVVGIMNSVNMLDNMDAVTGSTSMGILLTSVAAMAITGVYGGMESFVAMCMIGGLIGFLILNWNPSKVYMGDTGSMFIGVFLAYYGAKVFWNDTNVAGEYIFTRQLVLPLLVFLMPIMDTTFVSIARLSRGQSPFVGGRDHITHHLSYLGLSDRMVAVVTFSVTVLSGLMALSILILVDNWSHLHSLLFFGYAAGMFGLFFFLYRRGANNLRIRESQQAALEAEARAKNRDAIRDLTRASISNN